MDTYNPNSFTPQSFPFDTRDLGVFKGFYCSDELTFSKMHGSKSFLWIFLPVIGWIILITYFIVYLFRTIPTRKFWVFEYGFVWQKGSSTQKVLYADVDEMFYRKVAHYKNGAYGDTSHAFYLSKDGKTIYKNIAREKNEMDIEQNKTYLVRALEAAALEIQASLVNKGIEEYNRRKYVTIKDDEVLIGDGFIRDKTGYDYTPENIAKAYFDTEEGELVILGNDYKKKMIGYEGHKLTLSTDTNRMMKLYMLRELFGMDL